MISPERDHMDRNDDAVDSLVWTALGIEGGDFEAQVDAELRSGHVVVLARVAARLNFIADHDYRTIDELDEDYLQLARKRDMITLHANMFSDVKRVAYFMTLQNERRVLNKEMDGADFPPQV